MLLHSILQHLLPHKVISKIAHLCANNTIKPIKNYLIRYFLARYAVNMAEAKNSDPFSYRSFNEFFTRELKPGARKIATSDLVLPADGILAEFGAIQDKTLIQAKNFNYSLTSLLAGHTEHAQMFTNGSFATVYLAPHNYHRIHMPLNGKLEHMLYVPGKLFSVNPKTVGAINNIFAKNERLITLYATDNGPVAVILVGAMIVGGINTAWAGTICPPHTNQKISWDYTHEDTLINLEQGQDMGKFLLGSTVIVLTSAAIKFTPHLSPGCKVMMGQELGMFI
jgi:phosphatidylserine decarboxylase